MGLLITLIVIQSEAKDLITSTYAFQILRRFAPLNDINLGYHGYRQKETERIRHSQRRLEKTVLPEMP